MDRKPILSVRDLSVDFPFKGTGIRREKGRVQALRGVSFDLQKGECLGIVGESGSGKTTLVRALLRLVEPTEGDVHFQGASLGKLEREGLREFRKKAQIVFQDPFGSLNPRLRAGSMLEEILKVHGLVESSEGRRHRAEELLGLVGLHPSHAGRYPHEFSGGQRQRLGIARALSVEPDLLILDEPVSALDLSVQAQILNLLMGLREMLGLTVILVAHDLAVVRQMADRVAVLYGGRIVELSPVESLFEAPRHPYTRALMYAADPERAANRGLTDWEAEPGEPFSPLHPPAGCEFHPRCPHPEKDLGCASQAPELRALSQECEVACWKETASPNRG